METGIKNQHPFFTGGLQREYRLAIYPEANVYNKIIAEKQRFFMRYGVESVLKSFPYINVAGFYAGEGMDETLIRWLQRIFSQQTCFEIGLNNFSGFPNHTIYLRIQNPQPLQKLAHELKVLADHIQISSMAAGRWPHLTLAGELPEAVYEKAMPVYSRKTFHACFMASEVVLLARDHPYTAFKTITVFRFLPTNHRSYSEVA
jgi:2'-5' RNA ligase